MFKLLAPLLALLMAALPAGARAAATVTDEHTTASLLSATTGWTAGRPLRLGLRLQLAKDWHTYWSNPGDAGLAPDVTLSFDGAHPTPATLAFPSPRLLPTGPLMGYGYTGEVLLPFTATPPATAKSPLAIAVHAEWLVCAAVCVPESADLTLALPATPTSIPSASAPLFTAADAAIPRPSPFAASLSPAGLLRVAGAGLDPRSIAAAIFMPDTPGLIDQAAPQPLSVTADALTLALHPQPGLTATAPLTGVLAITDRSGAETDLLIHATRAAAPSYEAPPRQGLGRLLLLALAGGLVLNLMPCVFPILAMKAAALTRHGPDRPAGVRRSALLYTAGILVSFTAIGLVTIALRSAGSAAGWGFQFQSPAFVAATAWLLFAVGLNLSGLFEVGATLAGTGQHLAARGGALGDVMTGVLAVLVATPCTAPFMGAAVAAALSGPPATGLLIFLALGVGLALPPLALAAIPGAARLLPRPGAWMSLLRQALAFPMFAAAVWLFWVLSTEAGPPGILAGASGLLLIAFAGWLYGLLQRAPDWRRQTRGVLNIAALVSVLAALSILPGLRTSTSPQTTSFAGAEPFTPDRLAALQGQNRPVFVDMSAAWCVTCLVNERLALEPASVRAAFAAANVALLRGDWTARDAGITAFLHRFNRDGVPLYVYFPAHDATPRVLPQILTPGLVVSAITAPA